METPAGEPGPLPRWARFVGIPLAGLCLILLFVHLGFPYASLVDWALERIERSPGVAVRYGEASSHLGLFGPGIELQAVVVSRPDSEDVVIDRLILRPAWSAAWFRGARPLHIDARLPVGRARGVVALGQLAGFDGSLDDVELDALPEEYRAGLSLRGSLDAVVDIHYAAEGKLTGTAALAASDGSIGIMGKPVLIPFDSLEADLTLGKEPDSFLRVESASLKGPLVSASATGRVTRVRGGRAGLDIKLELAQIDKDLQPALSRLGLRMGKDATATARLGGTLERPLLR